MELSLSNRFGLPNSRTSIFISKLEDYLRVCDGVRYNDGIKKEMIVWFHLATITSKVLGDIPKE